VLEAEAGVDLKRDAQFGAGHSLGEYSALAAAGALSLSDTARLLRIRGRAMQKAVPVGTGAMAALIGLEFAQVADVAAEAAQDQICQAANDNGGGQVVVSGDKGAVERAVEIAKARGAKRAMMLPVSAPFHCALMQPAAEVMAQALAAVSVMPPAVPLVANVLARPISDPVEIVRRLVEQITGTVRWRDSVAFMAGAGVTTFYEIGAGKVLSGLVKRIAEGASGIPVGTPDDIATFVAAGGLGGAMARALHGQGAIVALSGTRREALDALAAELGARIHVLPCNLADKDDVESLVPKAEEAMGQLDILVANAGITRDNLLVQLRDEDWEQVVNVNLTATFRLARAAVRGMMRRRFGRVIGITSVVGITGNPGQSNYAATKAGMIGMMKSIAAEYAKRGVTANCVAPGFVATPMTDKLNDKQREAILSRVPAARLGTPADVAAAVVYLASDEAAYVTGQTLHVNGGMAMI
jgi:3-oxoacyl-(acyl-carrier-protein) reductase/malonyl CoA-acyl carrier protein transacylase